MMKNPVMFVTVVGAVLTTVGHLHRGTAAFWFILQIAVWLWFTVLFANFAEAVAEGRGKAQAKRCARPARTWPLSRRAAGDRGMSRPTTCKRGDRGWSPQARSSPPTAR